MSSREVVDTIDVCLFEPSTDDEHSLKDDHLFEDRLKIYDKDEEEIYIATSPSFSTENKTVIEGFIGDHREDQESKSTLEFCSKASAVEEDYSMLKTTDSFPIINTIDGQSYFVSSDYSTLSLELSKTYFYVVSPINNPQLLSNTDNADISIGTPNSCSQNENLDSLMHAVTNTTNEALQKVPDSVDFSERKQEFEREDKVTDEENQSSQHFKQYTSDFPVSFVLSDSKKESPEIVWKQVSTTQISKEEVNSDLLMKYEPASKVEILHAQPYLQDTLDIHTTTPVSTELVSTEQILGVTIPQILSCRWDGCNTHVLASGELIKHVNATHVYADKKQQYTCLWKGCVREGKSFDARYKMVIHLRTHTGEKPHVCSIKGCEASFARIENLKIHVRSHTGERPYPCTHEGCDKTFANSSDRFKHKRKHMEQKPYRCPVIGCGKSYTDPSSLRKHRKRHSLECPLNNQPYSL